MHALGSNREYASKKSGQILTDLLFYLAAMSSAPLNSDFHFMARQGHKAALAFELKHGLDPNLIDERGFSLLMIATYNGQLETMQLLCENGADPDLPDPRGNTPLMGIAYKGNAEAARILLQAGADPNKANLEGATPLMLCRQFGHKALEELLIAAGAQ